MPPLVRRALRARRPVPSKLVLARRGASTAEPEVRRSRAAPRCARVEGTPGVAPLPIVRERPDPQGSSELQSSG
jgi:hypothetical protein